MTRVIVIRPEPGCSATVGAARAQGMKADAFPLFAVSPCDWTLPEQMPDALLVGSANAFRHGGEQLRALTGVPVHVVGEATANAARQAGFTVAVTGRGGLQPVLSAIGPGSHVLRLSGEERIELDVPAGVTVEERVVYASRPVPMPPELADLLAEDDCLILLHSGVAADHLRRECLRLNLPMERIALAALAPRIAALAGDGWSRVETAEHPRDEALLALAGQLCQSSDETKG